MGGDRLGAYAIRAELGSGGMGSVHLAEVVEPVAGLDRGTRVALKILHPHLLGQPGFERRFLREASLGRGVRHRNVVRTFDAAAGEWGGHPVHYLVMEYVEGRSLRALLDELGRLPEALLRETAHQVAAGLAAIHAHGAVHRDLKPENILITDAHEVRIMDLGVAKTLQASLAITERGEFAGSLLYAAPEQFGSGAVTAAADLYALGVVLHELATGTSPFRRDTAEAVIEAQLTFRPPPLTDLGYEISPFLSEVVTTLLAKLPGERFGSSGLLCEVLAEGEGGAWWQERERARRGSRKALPEIAVRRETRLHGREHELATLREAWGEASAGRGCTVLVEGEAGIGKTRLVDAFARELEGEKLHVLYGSYAPGGGRGAISDAVLARFGPIRLADSLRPYLGRARGMAAGFAALLKQEPPPTGVAPVEREALHTLCCELLRALAAERPVLWIVDDLHFAEEESRGVFLSLARAAEGHRVLLVATTRPGLPASEWAHLSRLAGFRRLVPGRLSTPDVVELLRDAFRSNSLAERLGRRIAVKSDGVPFFVFEMIRGLRGRGLLARLPDGRQIETGEIEEIHVPDAVRDLIESRLTGLDRQERELLDVAAVSGFEFDADLVGRALDRPHIGVLRDLAEMERRRGVVRSRGGSLRFDHHLIREVLVEQLPSRLCAEYHTLLADACAGRAGNDKPVEGDRAVFLAFHHFHGVRPRDGLPHLEAALEQLEKSYRNEAALDLLDCALTHDSPEPSPLRVHRLLRKAARLDMLGRREAQEATLKEALALARELQDPRLLARVKLGLGSHLLVVSRYDEAEPLLVRARELAREIGDRKLETHATRTLAQLHLPRGRYEDARALFEEALRLAREDGDRFEECAAVGGIGSAFVSLNRSDDARRSLEHALALSREIGEKKFETAAIGNLGNLYGWQGRYDEARRYLTDALTLAREIGDRKCEASATLNLGVMFYSQGLYDDAEDRYAQHRALVHEIGDRRGEALAEGNLGGLLSARGRWAEALPHLERQVELGRELGDREAEALGLACLGAMHLDLGRVEEAEATLREAVEVARAIAYRYGEGYALQSLAALADERGQHEEAEAILEEVIALREETRHRHGLAEALLAMGQHCAELNDQKRARAFLDRALDLAREVGAPCAELAALAWLATLPGGDPGPACAALESHTSRVEPKEVMEARYRLWLATGDRKHLEASWAVLSRLRDAAPAEWRETMIERVPLHREIARAHASS